MSINGTGLRRLTQSGASQPAPCANGTIAYLRAGNVFLLNRAGTRARRLTESGGQRPDCAPNSRTIAFERSGRIYLVRVRGDRVSGPLGMVRAVSGPTFSSDGGELAFTFDHRTRNNPNGGELGPTDIFYLERIDLQGRALGAPHRISDDGLDDTDAGGHGVPPGTITWSPLEKRHE